MVITRPEDLPPLLAASVSPLERAFIAALDAGGGLPFGVSLFFAALAGPEWEDPIRRQFIPDPREGRAEPFALDDPLGEGLYRRAPRLIHQYRDRALLLAGGGCAGYCRHCFRRKRQGSPQWFIGEDELAPALTYLSSHTEIREVLISGGDPLTAGDEALDRLLGKLRGARPDLGFRLCTRVPVVDPERLTGELRDILGRYRPLRAAIQVNHPRELGELSRRALGAWTGAGIPVLVQTVLLRGINDRAETLAELFHVCGELGLVPYYLFQLDLAPGTAHFRVPLRRGLALYRETAGLLPPGSLPVYAVDLPGGGGKIPLGGEALAGEGSAGGEPVLYLRGPGGWLRPDPAT
jgi:lysine 2,3-aminomutase